jgi:GTPase involved in cell partitioning and DNA repair
LGFARGGGSTALSLGRGDSACTIGLIAGWGEGGSLRWRRDAHMPAGLPGGGGGGGAWTLSLCIVVGVDMVVVVRRRHLVNGNS